jgi:hypothetical protein
MRYLLFVPVFLLAAALPAGEPEVSSKAVTIESADFLKVPSGLDAKTFTVAATAPRVDVAFFADLKDKGKGTLWSSWGDGCLTKTGKYYTAVGDHLGADANSYVYEYDPATAVLKRVVDVLRAIGHMLGLFGHGKIHSGLHEAADGTLYFTTYWGKPKEVDAAYTKGYPGSLLLRFDPKTGKTENLGAIAPKQGLPASAFDVKNQRLFFHAVYKGDVVVYDLAKRAVVYTGGADSTAGHRTFLVDADGRAWFSAQDGHLLRYDPDKNQVAKTPVELPEQSSAKKNNTLRAATGPAKDGTLYGMTAAGRLFAFDPKAEKVTDLGPNFGGGEYTAVMALSLDEKYLYYAPGAHGGAAKLGVPVVQYDIAKKQRKVLAFLGPVLQEKLKWQCGGTYNLQLDPAGERLFFTFNGSAPGERSPFGKAAMVVVHIPAGERP